MVDALSQYPPEIVPSHEVEPPRNVAIVGGGVVGLFTGLELLQRGHKVNIIDIQDPRKDSDRPASVATGQFLPSIRSEDPQKQEMIVDSMKRTKAIFEGLAKDSKETGVMPVTNIELNLQAEETFMPDYAAEILDAQMHNLDTPITLTGPDGKPLTYSSYWVFDTFSLNPMKLRKYIARQFEEKGGSFEIRDVLADTAVTRDELSSMVEGDKYDAVINATGARANKLTDDPEFHVTKGHNITIKPSEPVPPIGIGAEDIIIFPREDGTFVIGSLAKDVEHEELPTADEQKELLSRIKELALVHAGPFKGIPVDTLSEEHVVFNGAGLRAKRDSGIRLEKENGKLVHAYGLAGSGWSLGPGLAHHIADLTVGQTTPTS